MELTQEELKTIFEYKEGLLYNKINRSSNAKIGEVAGSSTEHGYSDISIKGKKYKLHRLIWFWHTGKWPEYIIDHIDGDRRNNKIENLRDVPQYINAHNKTIGKGVMRIKNGRWRARIDYNGETIHLGYFDTEEEARKEYLENRKLLLD
jgi:hypothetical protein